MPSSPRFAASAPAPVVPAQAAAPRARPSRRAPAGAALASAASTTAPGRPAAVERPVALLASGFSLPRQRVTAEELERRWQLPSGWVVARTGVAERRFARASEGETNATLGARAAAQALEAAGCGLEAVDLLISAAGTVQQPIPCTAALVQRALGGEESGVPCFDVNATCLSFLAALDLAGALVQSGTHRRILLVSSEVASAGLDWSRPEAAALFGDGAAAFLVGPAERPGQGILHARLATFSAGAEDCRVEGGGAALPGHACDAANRGRFLFRMDGPALHRQASRRLPGFLRAFLAEAGTELGAVDWVVPHQAGIVPLEILRRKLGIDPARFVVTLAGHGNLIAASIPAALHLAIAAGRVRRGDAVLLLGTSAGFSVGAALLRY